jgi:hypothetical protein
MATSQQRERKKKKNPSGIVDREEPRALQEQTSRIYYPGVRPQTPVHFSRSPIAQ